MSKRPAPEDATPATTNSSKRQRFESSLTTMVGVRVGSDEAADPILVHEDLLCHHSDFFKAACKKEWRPEGQETHSIISLPAYEPDIFRSYVRRLYNPELSLATLSGNLFVEEEESKKRWSWEEMCAQSQAFDHLATLWVMADFLGDGQLADEIIDLLARCAGRILHVTISNIPYISRETTVESKLQRLVVDHVALQWCEKDLDTLYDDEIPSSFLRRVTTVLASFRDWESLPRRTLFLKYGIKHRECASSTSECLIDSENNQPCKAAK